MLFGQKKVDIIVIDQTNKNPFTRVSGDINGKIIQWIRANSHRVLAKKTANGEVTYCRLDDSDSTKYYDGTTAALDGSEGDVFMKMPEFYYKGTEGDIVRLYFANKKLDDEYVRWDPNILIGVYESYCADHNAYSRSGVTPTAHVQFLNYKSYAAHRGEGYRLEDWQMHCVMGCLYFAMYGNTDCSRTIGYGTSGYKDNGQTDSLGMTDTEAGGNGDNQSINFWGLENWWGNYYEMVHDYILPAGTLTATVDDPVNGGARDLPFAGYEEDGSDMYRCPEKMKFGRYLDLIVTGDDPKNSTPDADTGYCDSQWWPDSEYELDRILCRSSEADYYDAGVSYADSESYITINDDNVCSRLSFRGICVEETNVEAFKAIEIPSVYGVFIEATDGTLYKSTEWNGEKTANSVVVNSPEAAFRIALTQSDVTMIITNSNYTYNILPTSYTSGSDAKLDMNTEANMQKMLVSDSSTDYAAGYCKAFTFPDGKTKGLLPSLGWLNVACDNKSEVDACLSACGATEMDTENYHWSSTYYKKVSSIRCFWALKWDTQSVTYRTAYSTYLRVRPFAAL